MSRDAEYLNQILDAIVQVDRYASVGRGAFLSRSLRQDATIRQLIVVGEATKRISPELRARYPNVSWREAAGLRDFLVHHYPSIELEAVWNVTQASLPALKADILEILKTEGWVWIPPQQDSPPSR